MTTNICKDKLYGVVEGFYGKPWTIVQRKELFKRMNQLGLNVYMYAPKDDFKHRAYWRELYSVEEAEQLSNLIRAAKENNVIFYYAISPGLDMVYSSSKEINFLKRKLEQVVQFGCEAFAILFDDIEPELSETDKEVFQSFAQAQVSVTNQIYEALNNPKFLFCPTEYCASRAIPNVKSSEYLNTIGSKLINDIDIMWTGSKVISKFITVQQLQELADVLKRKPIIWDNLNANDFDQRRVFLGPYDGRSTDIKDYIAGVLTNPNCEYEANFIPFHTISYWSKCKDDIKLPELIEGDAEGDFNDNFNNLSETTYHPKRALKLAIEAWLPEFNKCKNVFPKPSDIVTAPLASAVNNLTTSIPTTIQSNNSTDELLIKDRNDQMVDDLDSVIKDSVPLSEIVNDSVFQPITKELTNSLLDPPVILNPLEPMDCADANSANEIKQPSSNVQLTDETMEEAVSRSTSENDLIKETELEIKEASSQEEMMQTELPANEMNYEDVNFLVDLFYLPFEHGSHGLQLMNEFHWLINNAYVIANYRAKKAINPEKSPQVVEWYDRASNFEKSTDYVARLLNKLILCKNRCLIYELYPYIWNVQSVISLLNSYIKWLSLGHVPTEPSTFLQSSFNWFSKGYRHSFESGESEPWIFRNGLCGDLQRLLPLESVNDLFLYKPPDSPSSHIFNIRPYLPSDEPFVYDVCRKTSLTDEDSFNDLPDLIGDKCVGSFLTLSSDFCFVVEDVAQNKICGYILAAPDSQQFQKKLEMAWIPDICLKYPLPIEKLNKGEALTSVEQMINDLHEEQKRKSFFIPEIVYNNYPSVCRIDLMDYVLENDASVPKRLLTCLLAALKANGSKGLFSISNGVKEKKAIDFYSKLGFQEVFCPNDLKANEEDVYLGRNI